MPGKSVSAPAEHPSVWEARAGVTAEGIPALPMTAGEDTCLGCPPRAGPTAGVSAFDLAQSAVFLRLMFAEC